MDKFTVLGDQFTHKETFMKVISQITKQKETDFINKQMEAFTKVNGSRIFKTDLDKKAGSTDSDMRECLSKELSKAKESKSGPKDPSMKESF